VFDVGLSETPANGYIWRAGDLPTELALLGQGYGDDDEPERVGAARERRFTFRAGERPGTFMLRFLLQRPWETTTAEEQSVTVVVE
jgi:predicted secreted protein